MGQSGAAVHNRCRVSYLSMKNWAYKYAWEVVGLRDISVSLFFLLFVFWIFYNNYTLLMYVEGEQNMPPQTVSLWQVDYFELKGIKNQLSQEKLFTSLSLNGLKGFRWEPGPERATTRGNFLSDLSVWRGKHLLLSLLSISFLPFEALS